MLEKITKSITKSTHCSDAKKSLEDFVSREQQNAYIAGRAARILKQIFKSKMKFLGFGM